MYSIGMFSQICRVTPKTLRHYDEIGLLRPARIDRFTGYRYYTTGQLPRMNQIQSLRQMGFSLTEIIALLDGGAGPETIRALLELKRGELAARIREDGQRLRLVENILRKGTLMMENYNVTIKELPEVIVAYLRTVIQSYDDLFHLMPEVLGPEMERLGCKCAEPEYCFNVYHYEEYRDHDIDVSLCQAVTERKEDSDVAKFQTVARVPQAACLLHKGPYRTLRNAYTFAAQWIEQNGYRLAGPPRESYIDGIWNKESEEDWLTELQFPVEKAYCSVGPGRRGTAKLKQAPGGTVCRPRRAPLRAGTAASARDFPERRG